MLGPLLFLIYVNDFHNCSTLLDFHLFADDANLFFQYRDIKMLESLINSELRVGQGFWVFGIQGRFKSGIRYIAA